MSITMQSRKSKGRRLELRIAKDLRESGLDKTAGRMPLSGAAFGLEADIRTTLPLKIEAKNQETWSPLPYYEQAKAHAGVKMPMVVMSKNNLPEPLVLIGWNDFLSIMQAAIKGGLIQELPFSKRKQVGK